ncbi:hypothetical protein TIFTF001_004548 [Ficus carica]|uniref:Uncharacterized protein n=1 Tax=Ficus carica TaxID=3494 RepID=A0AA87ZIV7_FICCA|nr:hypothetical protein TIFTF001_004548 [Ficus carica]
MAAAATVDARVAATTLQSWTPPFEYHRYHSNLLWVTFLGEEQENVEEKGGQAGSFEMGWPEALPMVLKVAEEKGEERERGGVAGGRGWVGGGRGWGRGWAAAGERRRERKGKRKRGRVAGRPAAGGGGAWGGSSELGVSRRRRGGSPASGAGDGKIAGDGEDFGWKNLNEIRYMTIWYISDISTVRFKSNG